VPIFCLDTSTRAGSMALWQAGPPAHAASAIHADPRSHAERLPLEAIHWLAAQGRTLADIDTFAVVSGPGSFTGLRVGVAAVQGWAFALNKAVIGVPTLDALASDRAVAGLKDVLVIPMIDGQRSEIFYSVWRDGVEIAPAAAVRPAEAIAAVASAFPRASVVAIGDGLEKYGALVDAAGWLRREVQAPLAESAVRLAAEGRFGAGLPHAIRPIYVRRPDAEVHRAEKSK
jgi:tRNA threonylcarbamoyladenosine biosynthesis protein TsaB